VSWAVRSQRSGLACGCRTLDIDVCPPAQAAAGLGVLCTERRRNAAASGGEPFRDVLLVAGLCGIVVQLRDQRPGGPDSSIDIPQQTRCMAAPGRERIGQPPGRDTCMCAHLSGSPCRRMDLRLLDGGTADAPGVAIVQVGEDPCALIGGNGPKAKTNVKILPIQSRSVVRSSAGGCRPRGVC
jgi:hypothetical protein